MVAKLLAVISAALLVGAVAIGALGPQDMSLGDALNAADHLRLADAEQWVRLHLSDWLWDHPLHALLLRPAWLVPASLGLLLAGGAVTANSYRNAPTSRRRRS